MTESRSRTKRGNNEGTIYRRKDGRWTGAITIEGGRVRLKRKQFYGRTRLEVSRKLTKALEAVQEGVPLPSDRLSLASFASDWLDTIRISLRPHTWESYEAVLRVHVIPALGHVPINKLGPVDLERMYADLDKRGFATSSVLTYHRRIHTMLEKAVRLGVVARNVAKLVDLPRQEQSELPMLSVEEVKAFLDAARGRRLEALFTLAVTSGARQGELLGLSWDRVNLDSNEIEIRQTLQRLNSQFQLGEPKTPRSIRTIALTTLANEGLRRHRTRQLEESLKLGRSWRNDNNLVFTTTVGTPLEKTNVTRRELRPLLQSAGLPSLRFHDLRHIAASLALSQGMPVPVVSEMLGHANPSITLRIYAHAVPGAQRQVADAMDSLLAS